MGRIVYTKIGELGEGGCLIVSFWLTGDLFLVLMVLFAAFMSYGDLGDSSVT